MLHLPDKVRQEIEKEKWLDKRRRYKADLFAMLDFDDPVCQEWQPELRKIDPRLSMARGRPLAYRPGMPVVPNYYHFIVDEPSAPVSCNTITGPDGKSFVEPDSSLLDLLRRNDMQNPEVYKAVLAVERERELQQEKAEQDHLQAMNEDVLEHWNAVSRAQVSMSRDTPWTQNRAGRRGAKRAK